MALPIIGVEPTFMNPVTQNDSGTTYTQRFQVLFNNSNATASEMQLVETRALTAPGIPRYGQQFRGNRAAFCNQITPVIGGDNQANHPFKVIVTCIFSTISVDKKDEENNPLAKSPDIVWATEAVNEVIENARILEIKQDNKTIERKKQKGGGSILQQINNFAIAITNSAGERFDPKPERAVHYPTVTIVQNLASFSPKLMINTVGTINVRAFKVDGQTITRGQALLIQRDATTAYQGKLSFRIVTTKLLIKQTHDMIILDQGFRVFGTESQKFNSGDPLNLTSQINGLDITTLQPLDGKGNLLGKGKSGVMLNYGIFKANDFRRLNLPQRRQ